MGTASGLLGVAVSGLRSSQASLSTVGHNIANASVEGYSRQRVDTVTRNPQLANGYFQGKGVEAVNIRRQTDSFLTDQVRSANSAVGQVGIFEEFAAQVDNLLADPDAGLSPVLADFFDAVQDVTGDPSSITSRQVLLSESTSLVQRFNILEAQLADIENGVSQRLQEEVVEINGLATAIADLNQDIQLAIGRGGDSPPNDLLDRRDQLLIRLAEHVKVTPIDQDDGTINVAIGTGQMLVTSTSVNALSIVGNNFIPAREEIGFDTGGGAVVVTDLLRSGTVAGLADFRSQFLDKANNTMGRMAITLANTFNTQHALGQDLNNNLGGSYFTNLNSVTPQTYGLSSNTGNGVFTAAVSNVGALTVSDYRLDFDGANYTMTRLDDNTTTVFAPGALPVTVDGFQLTLASGTVNAGDSYLVQPTRLGARDIGMVIDRADAIALASPLRTEQSLTNLGTATISAAAIANTTNLPLSGAGGNITLTFDAVNGDGGGGPGWVVSNGPGGNIAYNPATQSGGAAFTFAGFGGMSFTIAGVPQTGDTLTISDNTNGAGDNTNGLALSALQLNGVMDSGNTSFDDAYGQLVVSLGALSRQAQINNEAQQTLLQQAEGFRNAVAGVNLDEEAADLILFQQAYQANARIISIAEQIFQSLIEAVA